MRQTLKPQDEPYLLLRSLSIDYASGAREPAHSHPWGQLVFVQAGSLRLQVADGIWVVAPGRAVLLPAEQAHSLAMYGPARLRTLYLNPACLDSGQLKPSAIRTLEVCALLGELILRVCAVGSLDERETHHRQLYDLILTELSCASSEGLYLRLPTDPRGARLADLFMDEQHVNVPLLELCRAAGVTRRTAERLFRDSTGLSPARWRRRHLLARGLAALSEGVDVQTAAELAGYQYRSAFSQALTQVFGLSPGAVRKQRAYQAMP
ncbi:MAG: helix-turn-helix transcriptional regulator [Pseudomonadota bacterium]